MNNFRRVKELRKRGGLSARELGEKLGLSQQYISDIENGRTIPSVSVLNKLAAYFNVPTDYFLDNDKSTHSNNKPYNYLGDFSKIRGTPLERALDFVMENQEHYKAKAGDFKISTVILEPVPILGIIRAGEPFLAEQNIIGYEYLPEDMVQGNKYFGLKVTGDSMNLAQINDGNVVIVREQPEVENGEIAVVMVDAENATIKRFYRTDTMVTLMPESTNKEHQPRFIDITKETVTVLGKIVKVVINL